MTNQNRLNLKHSRNKSSSLRNGHWLWSIVAGVGTLFLSGLVACTPAPSLDRSDLYPDGNGYSGSSLSGNSTAIYLTPISSIVSANGTVLLSASGGVKPYTYVLISGLGTVNTSTGYFVASGSAGTSQVEVIDIQGNSAVATITITSGVSMNATTASSTSVTSVSTADGDTCPSGSVLAGTTYGVNGNRSICGSTGASSGGSTTVLTQIRLTAGGTHRYGVACPTGYFAMGYTPDCFGNNGCYGEQTICGLSAAAGSSQTVTGFYVTPLGQHLPSGPGCAGGYAPVASVVDCGGNYCSGYQQFCVAH